MYIALLLISYFAFYFELREFKETNYPLLKKIPRTIKGFSLDVGKFFLIKSLTSTALTLSG